MSLDEVPAPRPGAGQLQVRVLGAAANFPDVLMCRGLYQVKPPLPFTPGVELCGEVAALGTGATGFAVGDRVIGASVLPDRKSTRLNSSHANISYSVFCLK